MSSKFKIKPGVVSFKEFFKGFGGTFDDNGYYVDKTRFLKSIVEYDPRICLFTRPRRFGKSMFLSMMETFFSPNCEDVNDLSLHQKIFSKFEIFKDKVFSDALMGKIPVLHITFAGAKSDTSIENSIDKLVNAVCICANKYLFLSTSDKLSESEKQRFNDLCNFDKLNLNLKEKESQLETSLYFLCSMLKKHYGREVLVLVDEYDVPLSGCALTSYYSEVKTTLASMLELLLKVNEDVTKAVITGCMRVAKESIFTGWNNFVTVDFDHPKFSSLFGFTNHEVKKLLDDFDLSEYFDTFKDWYDGYRFGDDEIYCPWDVVNYTSDLSENLNAKPDTYWNNTSSNRLAMLAFAKDPNSYADKFKKLLSDQSVVVPYYKDMNYKMIENADNSKNPYLWSILYMAGYLTKDKDQSLCKDKEICLRIPNRCIKSCLKEQIDKSFSSDNPTYVKKSNELLECFKNDDVAVLERKINFALNAYVSIYDTQKGTDKEALYHAFLNGTLSSVLNTEYDSYASNKEIGDSRADIVFLLNIPQDKIKKCIIIECKVAKSVEDLKKQKTLAVQQVKDKYLKGVASNFPDANEICIYGIAFYKKECQVLLAKAKQEQTA